MHSPVWIDYDVSLELDDMLDDYELYPSDYFDEDVPKKRRRKTHTEAEEEENGQKLDTNHKRRKLEPTDTIPELSLGDPVTAVSKIVWRSSEHHALARPLVEDGQAEKVSFLKDWRERFKNSGQDSFFQMPRKTTKKMLAVVVEQKLPSRKDEYKSMMPPPVSIQSRGLASRGKKLESKTVVNGTLGTASSLAKQKQKLKPIPSINGSARSSSNRPATAQEVSRTTSKARKRKADELEEPPSDDELANGDAQPIQRHDITEPKTDSPPKTGASSTAGRKRKAPASNDEAPQRPTKWVASARDGDGGITRSRVGAKDTRGSTRKSSRKKRC